MFNICLHHILNTSFILYFRIVTNLLQKPNFLLYFVTKLTMAFAQNLLLYKPARGEFDGFFGLIIFLLLV